MVNIEAIEKSVMTADEKTLEQMAGNIPFEIYQQLSPEARSRLAHYAGGGFRPPLKETPKVESRVIAPPKFHAHRKLTEKERDRMIHLWASAPLTYRPDVDDELMKLGLVRFWDEERTAVENTEVPFYDRSGRILPEWYDFELQRTGSQAYGRGVKQLREVANQYENVTVMLPVEIISIIEGKTQEKKWGKINAAKVIRYVADMMEV